MGVLIYQIVTLFCLAISYHALSRNFLYVYVFFSEKIPVQNYHLTRTLNRKGLEQPLKKKILNCQIFVLVILDIDYFKNINDAYGHATGDEVLVRTAGIISRILRKQDVLARFGGEEFVVLIAGSNTDDYIRCCE